MEKEMLDLLIKLTEDMSQLKGDMSQLKGDMSQLKQDVDKLAINQENIIIPRLDLLYEGQVALRQQIDTQMPEKVAEAQTDISTLQSVVRIHSKDIKEIKDDITVLKQA